jgi:RNA polymerase sigma-70 factor (ECF subfamily)
MDTCRSQDEISVSLLAAAPDEVLVAAAKSGDRPAFAELWQRHSNTAFKQVHRITKNRADAEDVIQDAWMKAYVHLKTFDGRAKFSTWFTRIAINSALMMLRRKSSHPEASMEVTDGENWRHWDIADHKEDVEREYLKIEAVERLKRGISRLRPSLRIVVDIHQSNDAQLKEIAEILGISMTATKSRLSRARTILRRELS